MVHKTYRKQAGGSVTPEMRLLVSAANAGGTTSAPSSCKRRGCFYFLLSLETAPFNLVEALC